MDRESVSTLSDQSQDSFDDIDGSAVWSQDSPISVNEVEEFPPETRDQPSNALLCRLCTRYTDNPIFIWSEGADNPRIADMINTCLSVRVKKTNPLPKQICQLCYEKLCLFDSFDAQCILAEETLTSMLRPQLLINTSLQNHTATTVSFTKRRTPLSTPATIANVTAPIPVVPTTAPNVLKPSNHACQACPLCYAGSMCRLSGSPSSSDVIYDSSDDEYTHAMLSQSTIQVTNGSGKNSTKSILLNCIGTPQHYYKCAACTCLYHDEETMNTHKCRPVNINTSRPYTCTECHVTFAFEERLNFHLKCHGERLYCDMCGIVFGKEAKLFYHYKRYHCGGNSDVSCLQCGRLFGGKDELVKHVCEDGKRRPYVCEVCCKGFCDGYTLKRHLVTHLPEKPYRCSVCPKSFTQKSRLNKHVAGHSVIVETSQTVWRCTYCDELLATPTDFTSHSASHAPAQPMMAQLQIQRAYHCEFCTGHYYTKPALFSHQRTHTIQSPYTCRQCPIVFNCYTEAAQHYKDHERLFKVAVMYACTLCDREMKELSLLYKHLHRRHEPLARKCASTGTAKFLCELCGIICDTANGMLEHRKTKCSKYACDICNNLLPTLNSLNAHRRRHSGLRPYICNICGKSYTQSSHMWTHMRFHMGVKPYACQYCEQRFTIKPDLADHTRKKHTRERPFKCDVCGKAFLTGSVFYQHRLIHRGDRRYKCAHCERAFTRTEALNNHIKIHTGEKPHACDICGRCFRQKGDMRKHRRTQHDEKHEKT